MSRNDKLIAIAAIIVIILTFGWCIKLILGTPFATQIKVGSKAIQSGIPQDAKRLINSNL